MENIEKIEELSKELRDLGIYEVLFKEDCEMANLVKNVCSLSEKEGIKIEPSYTPDGHEITMTLKCKGVFFKSLKGF